MIYQTRNRKLHFIGKSPESSALFRKRWSGKNYIEAVAQKYHIGFENLRRLVGTYAAQTGLAQPIRPKSGVQKRTQRRRVSKTARNYY